MTTEKTAKEWFEMLKEPYRSQAIKASEEHPYPEKQETYESLTDAVDYDFTWTNTIQGWTYWHKIQTSIERGETTYLAEPPNQ